MEAATTFPTEGRIAAGESVKLQHKFSGLVKLHYTLDGTDPTELSPMYNPSTYQPELNLPIPSGRIRSSRYWCPAMANKTVQSAVLPLKYNNTKQEARHAAFIEKQGNEAAFLMLFMVLILAGCGSKDSGDPHMKPGSLPSKD
jgi:hypothetical protein